MSVSARYAAAASLWSGSAPQPARRLTCRACSSRARRSTSMRPAVALTCIGPGQAACSPAVLQLIALHEGKKSRATKRTSSAVAPLRMQNRVRVISGHRIAPVLSVPLRTMVPVRRVRCVQAARKRSPALMAPVPSGRDSRPQVASRPGNPQASLPAAVVPALLFPCRQAAAPASPHRNERGKSRNQRGGDAARNARHRNR